MEWFIAILILVPAVALALSKSSFLLDYAIVVLALNRGIRRIVDYYFNGYFNTQSPISLTPLLIAISMLIPAMSLMGRLRRSALTPFRYLIFSVALGLVVGAILNRFAAVYSLAEWMSSLATMAFAASQPASRAIADRWVRTAGYAAIFVAAYGVWQYYTIPPWDGMWLVQSGMAGYMGEPEPTKMTVFSTLNERGPCGTFLAWAVIPMILSKRWRPSGNIWSWAAISLLLWVIVLTQTRSNLIVVAVITLLAPALSSGKGTFRLLGLTTIIVVASTWGLDKIPGMNKINERFGAEELYGEGSSLQSRFSIFGSAVGGIVVNPLGRGLGSTGMGKRAEEGLGNKVETLGDSGYLQIFLQFGWVGGILFFAAMWKLWQEISRRNQTTNSKSQEDVDPFVEATRAILLGAMVFLFVGDIFAGFSLMWVFFGRSLSPETDPSNEGGVKALENLSPSSQLPLGRSLLGDTMRIAIVMPLAEQKGGAELLLLHLLKANQPRRVHDYGVAFLQAGPMAVSAQAFADIVKIFPAGRLRQLHRYVATVLRLARWLRQERFEAVMSWMSMGHLYGAVAARLAGIPCVWWQHGFADRSIVERLTDALPARAIFCCSQAVADTQAKIAPHSRKIVIHPAVDLSIYDPNRLPSPADQRQILGLPAEASIIGIIGRLQQWKGMDVFAEAATQLALKHPLLHFLIVGGAHALEPTYATALAERIATSTPLHGRITLAGYQANPADWMQTCDVIVHASIKPEPFGMVILEAMALGKRVIASAAGGPLEIIEPGVDGFLSPPGDAAALARTIEVALAYPEPESLAATAMRRASEFSTNRFAEKVEQELTCALQPSMPIIATHSDVHLQ